jgi:hypothetical protein
MQKPVKTAVDSGNRTLMQNVGGFRAGKDVKKYLFCPD